jgi:general secretion pathway protein D
MRIALCFLAAVLLATPTQCEPQEPACPSGAQCSAKPPSKSDIKKAKKAADRAQKLYANGKYQEAMESLDKAVELDPTRTEYTSQREMVRQKLIAVHIERGNAMLASGKHVEATAEFRQALVLDSKNEFALQRLQDANPIRPSVDAAPAVSQRLSVVAQSQPTVLEPTQSKSDFHLRGVSRNILEQVAKTYGIKVLFDDSVTTKQLRLDLEGVDFYGAMREVSKLARVFWVALTPKQIIFVNDTPGLRREFERMVSKTFYLTDATAPQDLNDVVNLLRTIFEIRYVVAQTSNNSIITRAPENTLRVAETVIETFLARKPQVNLDIKVFQISHNLTRQLGVTLPLSFQMIHLSSSLLASLVGNQNVQDLINQLIASGGINQANSEAVQALLAQVQNQQSSLLQTPVATFGGGLTLFGVTIPPITANFQLNESDIRTLSQLTLRTAQGNAAVMKLGLRYPIVNATFAPLFNSNAITQAIANQSFVAPFPSYTYEDLGINIKATPQVQADGIIYLKFEIAIKSLTGQSLNGVPVISNREYVGSMTVMDAETAFVVGLLSQSEQRSVSGIPGTTHIPVLRDFTTNTTKDFRDDELVIVITPHIVSPSRTKDSNTEVWMTGN